MMITTEPDDPITSISELTEQMSDKFFEIKKINSEVIDGVLDFLSNPILQKKAKEYTAHSIRDLDLSLNIFTLISDQYKKENFHSDILKILLNPKDIHKENDKFLLLFLDYLNIHERNLNIRKSNFTNVIVERERLRIDISIKDLISKRAIIIENKINNAVDMSRQLPKYWEKLESQGYQIDAVVYIVINGHKQPTTIDWTQEERDKILSKTKPVEAYNETSTDLFNGWLKKSESLAENIDTIFLLRHYNKLISTLGGRNMNKPLMEAFMQKMLLDNNYETAHALKDMLESLIIYRRDKIIDNYKFKANPFSKVRDWDNYAVFDEFISGSSLFVVDIVVTKNLYQFQFFERNFTNMPDISGIVNPALVLLDELNLTEEFLASDRRFEKQFNFPKDEADLYSFVDEFISKLRANHQH